MRACVCMHRHSRVFPKTSVIVLRMNMFEEAHCILRVRNGGQQARFLQREQQMKEESATERGNPTHEERWCLETH